MFIENRMIFLTFFILETYKYTEQIGAHPDDIYQCHWDAAFHQGLRFLLR